MIPGQENETPGHGADFKSEDETLLPGGFDQSDDDATLRPDAGDQSLDQFLDDLEQQKDKKEE